MPEEKTVLQAGDPCPICGGEMVPDAAHDPAVLADMKERNSDRPDVSARYRRQVEEKAKRAGIIHKCVRCGYQARFQPAGEGAATGQGAAGGRATSSSSGAARGAGRGGDESGEGAGAGARQGGGSERRGG
jgi:hypothetical protein